MNAITPSNIVHTLRQREHGHRHSLAKHLETRVKTNLAARQAFETTRQTNHPGPVQMIETSENLAVLQGTQSIQVWDLDTMTRRWTHTVANEEDKIYITRIVADKIVYAGSWLQPGATEPIFSFIRVFSAKTGENLATIVPLHFLSNVFFTDDEITGTMDLSDEMYRWDWTAREIRRPIQPTERFFEPTLFATHDWIVHASRSESSKCLIFVENKQSNQTQEFPLNFERSNTAYSFLDSIHVDKNLLFCGLCRTTDTPDVCIIDLTNARIIKKLSLITRPHISLIILPRIFHIISHENMIYLGLFKEVIAMDRDTKKATVLGHFSEYIQELEIRGGILTAKTSDSQLKFWDIKTNKSIGYQQLTEETCKSTRQFTGTKIVSCLENSISILDYLSFSSLPPEKSSS